jgi:hypothetical protein
MALKRTMCSLPRGQWRTRHPRCLRRIKSGNKLVSFAHHLAVHEALHSRNVHIENQVSGVQAGRDNNATLINGASVVLGATGGMEAIERGVNHFLEGSDILMKSLDEVAKLHPFVGGATREPILILL